MLEFLLAHCLALPHLCIEAKGLEGKSPQYVLTVGVPYERRNPADKLPKRSRRGNYLIQIVDCGVSKEI